ncbi:MAG: UV DNA damage repair endonuclease UvsE [Clostridium sp.]
MKIGYACIPLTIPYRTNRTYRLSTYTNKKASEVISNNLNDLLEILKYNNLNNIKLFRISSDIIPLASHPNFDLDWISEFKDILSTIGSFIKTNNIRVSMHPGQYTILNSPKEEVVQKSIADLKFHADFLDSLGIDYSHKLILHIGGVYNDKNSAINRFITTYKSLPKNIKARLIIENDERCFSFDDVFYISTQTGAPVIFDNLHQQCYLKRTLSNVETKEILIKAASTWDNCVPKIHYSQQAPDKKIGSHSPTIRIKEFLEYYNLINETNLDIDIMLEVKDKNLSVLKVNNIINKPPDIEINNLLHNQLHIYQYFLISKGFDYYTQASEFRDNSNISDFYNLIDNLIPTSPDIYGNKFVVDNFFSMIKDRLTSKEINYFNKLFKETNYEECKSYLFKLCTRYNTNLQFNYYFIY